jgi:hypothetical protein
VTVTEVSNRKVFIIRKKFLLQDEHTILIAERDDLKMRVETLRQEATRQDQALKEREHRGRRSEVRIVLTFFILTFNFSCSIPATADSSWSRTLPWPCGVCRRGSRKLEDFISR